MPKIDRIRVEAYKTQRAARQGTEGARNQARWFGRAHARDQQGSVAQIQQGESHGELERAVRKQQAGRCYRQKSACDQPPALPGNVGPNVAVRMIDIREEE